MLIVDEAGAVCREMQEIAEASGLFVVDTQAFLRTYPKASFAVRNDTRDIVVHQAVLGTGDMIESPDLVSVEPVQAVIRAKPDKSIDVLGNTGHLVVRQAFFVGNIGELEVRE